METMNVNFGDIDDEVLPKQIADRLLTMIKEKQLQPGDKLLPERELAAMLAVGRPALREALQALSIMNVIEVRQGSGAYISSLDPAQLVAHLDFIFSLHNTALPDLAEACRVVESGAISLAAKGINNEEVKELEKYLKKLSQSVSNPGDFARLELELHKLFVCASRNPFLIRCVETLTQMSLGSQRCLAELPGFARKSLADHGAIIAALKAGNAEAAQQAMLGYLDHVEQKLSRLDARVEVTG